MGNCVRLPEHRGMEMGQHSKRDESVAHISERDAPAKPRRQSLFVDAMQAEKTEQEPAPGPMVSSGRTASREARRTSSGMSMKRSNSTSTLFVDSTVSQPDLDRTLKCVAIAISYHLKESSKAESQKFHEIFDERAHSLGASSITTELSQRELNDDTILVFIKTLFASAALTAECGIITLIYMERLIENTHLTLNAHNWKRVVLGAILLASKVWDDQAVWNVDFITILPEAQVEDLNKLEKLFLEQLFFNVSVASSLYTKYFLDLRSIASSHATLSRLIDDLKPLTVDRARELEAMTIATEAKVKPKTHRAKSLEEIFRPSQPAILS